MHIKSVKMKISKNKKMRFLLMSQGSLNPKIRFLCQEVCSVARLHTRKWIHVQRTPFEGFNNVSFNLSPRIGPINDLWIREIRKSLYYSSNVICFISLTVIRYFWTIKLEQFLEIKNDWLIWNNERHA